MSALPYEGDEEPVRRPPTRPVYVPQSEDDYEPEGFGMANWDESSAADVRGHALREDGELR